MREPENCNINYVGYESPRSKEEVEFEILGLKNLIKKAEEKISKLEQTKFLVKTAEIFGVESLNDLFLEKK
tara:strand:+ start:341 stop:553 length:213 start_codon:yes stop_codon:yes gene_type:complete